MLIWVCIYQVSRMGSTTSLNPDKISQRNEDRLRKLKSLAGYIIFKFVKNHLQVNTI